MGTKPTDSHTDFDEKFGSEKLEGRARVARTCSFPVFGRTQNFYIPSVNMSDNGGQRQTLSPKLTDPYFYESLSKAAIDRHFRQLISSPPKLL